MTHDWRSVPLPDRMEDLHRDRVGRPVPWFVSWENGEPDFRIARSEALLDAIRFELCWVCGKRRGRHAAFLVGPMCAVNLTSSEPPSHRECAVYSARACPFMANPGMRRRPVEVGVDGVAPAGEMILRNPGVGLVWSSKDWTPFGAPTPDGGRGVLFHLGNPTGMSWWSHGRAATRDEVLASIDSGIPLLEAEAVRESPAAVAELGRRVAEAMRYLPDEQPS